MAAKQGRAAARKEGGHHPKPAPAAHKAARGVLLPNKVFEEGFPHPQAPQPPVPKKKKNWAWKLATAILATVVAGLILWMLFGDRAKESFAATDKSDKGGKMVEGGNNKKPPATTQAPPPPPPTYEGGKEVLEAGDGAAVRLAAMPASAVVPLGRHPEDAAADADRQVVFNTVIPRFSLGWRWGHDKVRASGNWNINHQFPETKPPPKPETVKPPPVVRPPPTIQPPPPPHSPPGCPGCGGNGGDSGGPGGAGGDSGGPGGAGGDSGGGGSGGPGGGGGTN